MDKHCQLEEVRLDFDHVNMSFSTAWSNPLWESLHMDVETEKTQVLQALTRLMHELPTPASTPQVLAVQVAPRGWNLYMAETVHFVASFLRNFTLPFEFSGKADSEGQVGGAFGSILVGWFFTLVLIGFSSMLKFWTVQGTQLGPFWQRPLLLRLEDGRVEKPVESKEEPPKPDGIQIIDDSDSSFDMVSPRSSLASFLYSGI